MVQEPEHRRKGCGSGGRENVGGEKNVTLPLKGK